MKPHMVIPAVRGFKQLDYALRATQDTIFLLEGQLIQLPSIVETVQRAGKRIFLHMDMIKGIKDDEASIHYLAKALKVDGVISTHTSCLNYAKKYGLSAIQRGFMIDSHSVRTIVHSAQQVRPDYIELLPSYSYPKIKLIKEQTGVDIILGGFIETAEDVSSLFAAGAYAVSTSRKELWGMGY